MADKKMLIVRQKQKSRKPSKTRLSALYPVFLSGFDPLAFRLGVAPIRHREVTSNAKKCLEIQGFSAFQILSDTTL